MGELGGRSRPALGARELERRLRVPRGLLRSLERVLRELERRRVIERLGFRYRLRRADGLFEGVVESRDAGRGAVRGTDRVLELDDLAEARPGDRVLVQELADAKSGRAELYSILESPRSGWIGLVQRNRRGFEIVPYRDSGRGSIPIERGNLAGAEVGEVVEVAAIGRSGSRGQARSMRVVERLGQPGDPEADFRAVAWRHRLPREFSERALEEARQIPAELEPAEISRRLDLRDLCFVTIDPESARDHDDAVYVQTRPGVGPCLWVAIADVSHCVRADSELDREARLRGNSVYFPGRSIPMLPERLSSELCSLRPDEDRYVLAVEMHLDEGGELGRATLHEAVIRSRMRLSYQDANAVMENAGTSRAPSRSGQGAARMGPEVREQLRALAALCSSLRSKRLSCGSIDFDLPEPEFILDSVGRPIDVRRAQRGAAHHAIEEAMLLANRAVAKILMGVEEPTVYRIHETPDRADLERLAKLYRNLGLAGGDHRNRFGRQELLAGMDRAVGRPEEAFVQSVTLRAMKQARYSQRSSGHFALGFDHYLHFTSPIRRYADLVVHRSVRKFLESRERRGDAREEMERIAIRTSARERIAVTSEREMNGLMRCTVMRGRVGESFDGIVTGVAEQGLYVTLAAPFVEGLVPISSLDGYFDYDPDRQRLIARRSGHHHGLGDRLRVLLNSVDPIRGWINFLLNDEDGSEVASGRGNNRLRRSGRPRSQGRGGRMRGRR